MTPTDELFLSLYVEVSDAANRAKEAYKSGNLIAMTSNHEQIERILSLIRFTLNAPSRRITTIANNYHKGLTNWAQAIEQLDQYRSETT